jgi:pimeloyl-ACP methyl ester carboxylesterase
VSGCVDVRALGGVEWRDLLSKEQPDAPRWFFDDASDFTSQLGSLHLPALVLSADSDPLSPARVGEFLRDASPGATCEVLAGGHSVAFECPDAVAAAIARMRGAQR